MPSQQDYNRIEEQGDKLFWTKAEISMWKVLKIASLAVAVAVTFNVIVVSGATLLTMGLIGGSLFSWMKEKKTTEELGVMYDAIAAKNSTDYLGDVMYRPRDQVIEPEVEAKMGQENEAYPQNRRSRPGSFTGDVSHENTEERIR